LACPNKESANVQHARAANNTLKRQGMVIFKPQAIGYNESFGMLDETTGNLRRRAFAKLANPRKFSMAAKYVG
jgi:hypothetical protein